MLSSGVALVGVLEPTRVERDCVDLDLLAVRIAVVDKVRYFSSILARMLLLRDLEIETLKVKCSLIALTQDSEDE